MFEQLRARREKTLEFRHNATLTREQFDKESCRSALPSSRSWRTRAKTPRLS